nr:Z protein [unidentified Reptarenavirus]
MSSTAIGLTTEIISIVTFVVVVVSFITQIINCITMLTIKGITLRRRLRFCQGCGKNASLVVLPCKNSVCMECALKMKCPVCFEPCLWCENPDGSLTSLALVNKEMGRDSTTARV